MIRNVAWSGMGFVAALVSAFSMGCGGAPDESDGVDEEQNLKDGSTRIASSLEAPGDLVVVGDRLVFSTAHFVASGDPELDQEFAFWQGRLWTKPMSGQKKKLADTSGAVLSTARLGDDLLVVDSTYMGVTRYGLGGAESDFYNDFSHFGDEGDEGGQLGGVAVGKSGVYVSRPGSEIMSMKNDGSSVKTFAKTFKSGFVEMAQKIVVLDGAVFWSAEKEGEQGSTYNLYRASVSGAHTPKKLGSFHGAVTSLATDGAHVFVAVHATQGGSEPGRIAVLPADGSKAPKTLVADEDAPANLTYDARFGLFFTESDPGAVELVPNAAIEAGAAATPIKVLKVDSPTSIAMGQDHLFIASDPGEINEKKGQILKLPIAKIPAK